jgi:putative DNA primase/helicase
MQRAATGRGWPGMPPSCWTSRTTTHAGLVLLGDIRELFEQRDEPHLTSADIVEHLVGLENRKWAELNNGKPLTKNRLAALLKQFEVTPSGVRVGDRTPKGYALADFTDAFSRYLPPIEPQQRNNADAN